MYKRYFTPTQELNSFAKNPQFADVLQHAFQEDILPPLVNANLTSFSHSDIRGRLYENQRRWKVQNVGGRSGGTTAADAINSTFKYESELDRLFWRDDAQSPWICVLGSVGCGKSTFVDYYMRCYCPNSGLRRNDFGSKVALRWDAKGTKIVEQASRNLSNSIISGVKSAVKRSSAIPDSFDFERSLDTIAGGSADVRVRAPAALQLICSEDTPPYKYVVIILDNLDECSIEVQEYVIREVQDFVEQSEIDVWRVICPLWPETYRSLTRSRLKLLRNSTELSLGSLDEQSLLRNRVKGIERMLGAPRLSDHRFRNDADIFVRSMLTAYDGLAADMVAKLFYGNLRSSLSALGAFLTGRRTHAVHETQLARARETDDGDTLRQSRGDYEFVTSLIRGDYDYLNVDASPFANVFSFGHAHLSPRDTLIGLHVLSLLRSNIDSLEELERRLERLGYSPENIRHGIESWRQYNAFHEIYDRTGSNIRLVIHSDVVENYFELVATPEYLDAVAPITFVDVKYCGSAFSALQSSNGFEQTCEATLSFIKFIESCESEVEYGSSSSAASVSLEHEAALLSARITRFSKLMAENHRSRIVELHSARRRFPNTLGKIDDTWWTSVLKNEIYKTARLSYMNLGGQWAGA